MISIYSLVLIETVYTYYTGSHILLDLIKSYINNLVSHLYTREEQMGNLS